MSYKGLSQSQARVNLHKYGYNIIDDTNRISAFDILLRQVKNNFIIYLLLVSVAISFFVSKITTGVSVLIIIIFIIVIGFIQEYKAERAVESLKGLVTPKSIVIRDSKEIEILSSEVTYGDIVVLRSGERICADILILESKDFTVNESLLTGESSEVKKHPTNDLNKYNEKNIAYMGTHVANGKCIGKVINVGMDTELGRTAKMISKAQKELPLQTKVNSIAKYMSIIAVIFSVLSGIIILLNSETITGVVIVETLIVVIALCVAAFPEGMPVVLISTLAKGAYRMAKHNAIVNRMSIIETLGETTVICSDKTGTITTGEMTVKEVHYSKKDLSVSGSGYNLNGSMFNNNLELKYGYDKDYDLLLKSGVICNDSKIYRADDTKDDLNVIGSSTEGAILVLAAKSGLYKEDLSYRVIQEIPFSSKTKMMSVVANHQNQDFVFSKGALECIIEKCKYIRIDQKNVILDELKKSEIIKLNSELSSKSYRVLAFAYKEYNSESIDSDLVYLGLVAMQDPPRLGVKDAISVCNGAGIKVKMITGDNLDTAKEIANQIGLYGESIDGQTLDKLTDSELTERIDKISVFARVRPDHKLRIVKLLKEKGEIVTMTGDGVNDAPALKESHVGVAMGINGSQVSRDSADLILKDDNFVTIVDAIKEGRTIYNNIQKCVSLQLTSNTSELSLIFFSTIINIPLPLVAMQILLINLVTDDLPAIALGFQSSSKDSMNNKPKSNKGILNNKLIIFIALLGILIGMYLILIFYICLNYLSFDLAHSRTIIFSLLMMIGVLNAFNYRSFRNQFIKSSPFSNMWLLYASICSITVSVVIMYSPLSIFFEMVPLSLYNWIVVIIGASFIVLIFDVLKYFIKKNNIDLFN